MPQQDIRRELIAFLEETSESPANSITPETDLIESGVVDSFSIVQLLMFLEERLDVTVAIEDLMLDTVRTPNSILRFYARETV